VILAWIVHVVWKMARFDPEWMSRAVEEKVEETVDKAAKPNGDGN